MNYERETNIYISISEGDTKMVSYIYTKTSSIFLINTPQKISLKTKEMDSLSSNIDSGIFLSYVLGFESYHGSCLLSTIEYSGFLVYKKP